MTVYISNSDFRYFRSQTQHNIKYNWRKFLLSCFEEDVLDKYFRENNILYCLYTLACIDTLCIEHGLPMPEEYEHYRVLKLKHPFIWVPNCLKEDCLSEFVKKNIYEISIYDVY